MSDTRLQTSLDQVLSIPSVRAEALLLGWEELPVGYEYVTDNATDELATLRTENERLQSRVAELEAAQTPRPIEDAPRDGTMILAYRKSLKTWGVAYMDGHMWNVSPYGGEWLDDDAFSGWLPLPPATTEATE